MRSGRRVAAVAAVLLAGAASVHAGDAPIWMRLLRWAGGDSSDTPVPTTLMGKHMQMSLRQEPLPGDEARADAIRAAAARVLEHYRNVEVAEREGYRAFAPRGVVGEEVHYTNSWKARREQATLDLERPGSILYRRTSEGLQAVGVMYTAPAGATPAELDRRVPLSVGVWHRHVHFCGWPSSAPRSDWDGPNARFGYAGSIGNEAECIAAGGYWIPLVLGWMTHVYPYESEPDRVWTGEHMMKVGDAVDAHAGHSHEHHDGHHGHEGPAR